MAVLEADIAHAKVSSSNADTTTTYTVEYNVKCSSSDDGPVSILFYFYSTPGLPYFGDYFQFFGETDLYTFVTRINSTKKQGSQFEWTTTVQYEQTSATLIGNDGNPTQNPLLELRQYNLAFAPRQIPVEQGRYYGQWYILPPDIPVQVAPANVDAGYYEGASEGDYMSPANSAGDAFDPPMVKDQSDLILHCRVNLASYDGAEARSIQDKVNSEDMQLDLGFPYGISLQIWKWQCKCVQVGATHVVREWYNAGIKTRTFYWEVNYEFHIRQGFDLQGKLRPNGWSEWIVDRGYNRSAREGDPVDGDVFAAPDPGEPLTTRIKSRSDGLPISEPANLNGKGQPLEPLATPHYLHFLGHDTEDMIGLPVGFTEWTPPPIP